MIFSPILEFATVPDSSINSRESWFIFNLRKNKHLLLHEYSLHVYTWGGISKSYLLSRCCITMWLFCFWDVNQLICNVTTRMVFAVISSLRLVHTLLGQCTYLGYLLLEAPRKYVQYGPLVSLNWLWLFPQSGTRVRSHAVRRRMFIVLMTAAHISPNVFSLQNFLSNIHVLFLAYIHRHSYLLYITFEQYLHPFITRQIILSFLQLLLAGWLLSVSRVRYN